MKKLHGLHNNLCLAILDSILAQYLYRYSFHMYLWFIVKITKQHNSHLMLVTSSMGYIFYAAFTLTDYDIFQINYPEQG